jgi:O-acetyl-ADP-ribose deacetylase (regulator of RNase III)
LTLLIKSDVIVNVTNPALNLVDGILSASIARAAGPQISYFLQMRYSNGIKVNEIDITPAFQIWQTKQIYHITCPIYSNDSGKVCRIIFLIFF